MQSFTVGRTRAWRQAAKPLGRDEPSCYASSMKSDTVVAAVDLGETTEAVVRAAAAARKAGAELLIAHCLPDLQGMRPLFPERGADDLTRSLGLEDAVRRHLTDLVKRIGLDNARVVLGVGQPYAAVTQLASDHGARLIVIGAPSSPDAWFAGTALRIVRYAGCPVLVHRAAANGPVLAATDLSDQSLPAITAGAALATHHGSKLVVLHAIDVDLTLHALARAAAVAAANITMPVDTAALHRVVQATLDSAVQEKAPAGTGELLWGPPADTIVQRARSLGASVIVVATHGRTGLDRVLVGSVAENVVRMAPCSVLVARHVEPS